MSDESPTRLFSDADRDTLDEALDTWGQRTQEDHAIEELGELLTAIMQYRRRRVDMPEVRDEIADALIVVNQLALIYGVDETEGRIDEKLQRLRERLADADTNGGNQ